MTIDQDINSLQITCIRLHIYLLQELQQLHRKLIAHRPDTELFGMSSLYNYFSKVRVHSYGKAWLYKIVFSSTYSIIYCFVYTYQHLWHRRPIKCSLSVPKLENHSVNWIILCKLNNYTLENTCWSFVVTHVKQCDNGGQHVVKSKGSTIFFHLTWSQAQIDWQRIITPGCSPGVHVHIFKYWRVLLW